MKEKTNYSYPISITLNKTDGVITRELITSKFEQAIKDYYGVEHLVDFNDIKKSVYQRITDDSIVLDYIFSSGEIPEMKSSTYSTMLEVCRSTDNIEPRTLCFDSMMAALITNKSNYDELSELATIYIGMKYDQSRELRDNEWDILKFILKNKIKNLFKNKRDGTYHEVQAVDFKLDKLSKFNTSKFIFVSKRLKRKGKTLTNFSNACSEWDKEFKVMLKLSRDKHSMELRTDLAMSGLNDDII